MMKTMTPALSLLAGLMLAAPVFAQSAPAPASDLDRNVQQQQRIENGLKSGKLTAREAGKLERDETKVEKMESKAAADGKVSAAEEKRIDREQQRVSHDIAKDKSNGAVGNPESKSSERMEGDVARDKKQQERIDAGVKSGSLTTHEAGALEHGQAHDTRLQAKAAANGHVSAEEQEHLRHSEEKQSERIHDKKTNHRHAG